MDYMGMNEAREKLRTEIHKRLSTISGYQNRHSAETAEPLPLMREFDQDFVLTRYGMFNEICGLVAAYNCLFPEDADMQKMDKALREFSDKDKKFIFEKWRKAELGSFSHTLDSLTKILEGK